MCKNPTWSAEVEKPFGGFREYESSVVIEIVIKIRYELLVQFREIEVRISPKS